MNPKSTNAAKTFRVVLEKVESSPPWVIARLPFDPNKIWPDWNRRIRGTVSGFAFQTSVIKSKAHGYFIVVFKKILKGSGAKAGDKVEIRIEPDPDERNYAEPKELIAVLRQDRDLRKWFNDLPSSYRRWFAMWIDQAKRAETRKDRAERVAELIMQIVEGEQIAPPILRAAFQLQPLAEQGWNVSTKAQRRNFLLTTFMAQGVEARQRRVAYVVDKCLETARRKNAVGRTEDARFDFE
jgi:uncharacterized protein YdeI (YjbR/CyaY-like superfamily)